MLDSTIIIITKLNCGILFNPQPVAWASSCSVCLSVCLRHYSENGRLRILTFIAFLHKEEPRLCFIATGSLESTVKVINAFDMRLSNLQFCVV